MSKSNNGNKANQNNVNPPSGQFAEQFNVSGLVYAALNERYALLFSMVSTHGKVRRFEIVGR